MVWQNVTRPRFAWFFKVLNSTLITQALQYLIPMCPLKCVQHHMYIDLYTWSFFAYWLSTSQDMTWWWLTIFPEAAKMFLMSSFCSKLDFWKAIFHFPFESIRANMILVLSAIPIISSLSWEKSDNLQLCQCTLDAHASLWRTHSRNLKLIL